jgi:hypothetical protein
VDSPAGRVDRAPPCLSGPPGPAAGHSASRGHKKLHLPGTLNSRRTRQPCGGGRGACTRAPGPAGHTAREPHAGRRLLIWSEPSHNRRRRRVLQLRSAQLRPLHLFLTGLDLELIKYPTASERQRVLVLIESTNQNKNHSLILIDDFN